MLELVPVKDKKTFQGTPTKLKVKFLHGSSPGEILNEQNSNVFRPFECVNVTETGTLTPNLS